MILRQLPWLALACLLGTALASHAAGDLKVWSGGPTPALELKDIAGRTHRLEDYRGRVVLLNFWATWCAPCRQEMPSIEQLKKKLAKRPFVVLAVNVDEPESRVRNFLEQVPLDFPTLLDPEARTTREWKVRVLPASFVIAPSGRIRYTVTGDLDWANEHVVRVVSELLPFDKPKAERLAPQSSELVAGAFPALGGFNDAALEVRSEQLDELVDVAAEERIAADGDARRAGLEQVAGVDQP